MKIAAKLDLRMGGVFTLYPDGLAGNTVLALRLIAASEGTVECMKRLLNFFIIILFSTLYLPLLKLIYH